MDEKTQVQPPAEATGQSALERLVRPHRTPTRAEVEALMKRCQALGEEIGRRAAGAGVDV